ncbi:winged helix-turn-helix domain-containing protein [Chitinophaga sp. Mgbs1]|uniref:Winged helix-turn-helix domain-containing protein n=1 Tax=Chitinophaga solisilvae TaxID=1233460 RepID=A0A3S1B0T0_9BACT|nr:winged helix-turn-helix domain-containing protein [Chitinophaga solisilvae]
MSLRRYLERLHLIDNLIRKKQAGSQQQLASKVGVSRSSLNEFLKEMKEEGFPIKYCKKSNTYYYEEDGNMVSSLFELSKEDLNKHHGGIAFFGNHWYNSVFVNC